MTKVATKCQSQGFTPPGHNCPRCPRLVAFREQNRAKFPDKFNAPVPPFGPLDAQFLIAGLAPGLRGANFSGRPFTGDYAGDLLYATLLKMGFATGIYDERADDGLTLKNCRITNAVRCVPPQNKPEPDEIANCRDFLEQELAAMPNLKLILALGKISHDSLIRFAGEKLSAYPFGHGKLHKLPSGLMIIDSYHCSRYNTQTKRLTEEMFEAVFAKIKEIIST